MPKLNKVCNDYLAGECKYGSKCKFLHDRKLKDEDKICIKFLKGYCQYGNKCKFQHNKENEEVDRETQYQN